MTAIIFGTLKFAHRLKDAGFPDHQAEALVQVHREALAESLDTTLATKNDISQVRLEIAELRSEMKIMKWMLGLSLASSAGILTLVLKLAMHG